MQVVWREVTTPAFYDLCGQDICIGGIFPFDELQVNSLAVCGAQMGSKSKPEVGRSGPHSVAMALLRRNSVGNLSPFHQLRHFGG